MILDITPDQVNAQFTNNGVYSKDLIIWKNVEKAYSRLKLISGPEAYDNNGVLSAISEFGFCIVEVDFDGIIATPDDKHWVVFTGNHQLNDPWDGATKSTSNYPILKRWVSYQLKPAPTPTPFAKEEIYIDRPENNHIYDETDIPFKIEARVNTKVYKIEVIVNGVVKQSFTTKTIDTTIHLDPGVYMFVAKAYLADGTNLESTTLRFPTGGRSLDPTPAPTPTSTPTASPSASASPTPT